MFDFNGMVFDPIVDYAFPTPYCYPRECGRGSTNMSLIRRSRTGLVFGAVVCASLSFIGCAGDPVQYYDCQPGEVQACICDSGELGLESCSTDYRWGICQCQTPDTVDGDEVTDTTDVIGDTWLGDSDGSTDVPVDIDGEPLDVVDTPPDVFADTQLDVLADTQLDVLTDTPLDVLTDTPPDESVDTADVDIIEGLDLDAQVEEEECLNTQACHTDLNLWWFDCRGDPVEMAQNCAEAGMVCKNDSECCTEGSYEACLEGDWYAFDSCDNPESVSEYCEDVYVCTTDSCETDGCEHLADCSDPECIEHIWDCQCHPIVEHLTCGSSVVGTLSDGGPNVTNILTDYPTGSAGCGTFWEATSDGIHDGNEVVYVFNYDSGPDLRTVGVTVRWTLACASELMNAIVLDGTFTPCDTTRCITQARSGPV